MIYAMSDIHGSLEAFEERLKEVDLSGKNRLVLLGDYIDYGTSSAQVLERIYELQKTHGAEKVIVLKGNHEDMLLQWIDQSHRTPTPATEADWPLIAEKKELIRWIRKMPLYYQTGTQIYVHAGVDEEAEDLWQVGTSDEVFLWKYPATTGSFYMTIIAGHVGTYALAGKKSFHDIYYDGASHYYIDGTVYNGGKLNLFIYDEETDSYRI